MTSTYSSATRTYHLLIEPPHTFVEMHHYGNPDGLYCPTGFAVCTGEHDPDCDAVRDFDGDCRLWGQAEADELDMTAEEFRATMARGTPVRVCKSRPEYVIRLRLHRWASLLRRCLHWGR